MDSGVTRGIKQIRKALSQGGGGKTGVLSRAKTVAHARGRVGVTARQKAAFRQRVTVKARVVRAPLSGAKAAMARHVDYLERDGVDQDGERGVPFNEAGEMAEGASKQFATRADGDRHHFRLIVSPENGHELDLREYTQDLMQEMEQDLGTRLDWMAVSHYNTDNPHVHILLRGVDERGGDLVINRDYISHGIRNRAEDLATRELGLRKQADIDASVQRELGAERFTAVDRALLRDADGSDGVVNVRVVPAPTDERAGRFRLNKIARLEKLEALGLAEEIEPGRWKLENGLDGRLRELGARRDVIAKMQARLRGVEEARDYSIYSKDSPPAQAVEGRVVARGLHDEQVGSEYVVVSATDGRQYYVALGKHAERPGFEAREGAIVSVGVEAKQLAGAADRNIAAAALRNGGVYDADKHKEWAIQHGRVTPSVDPDEYIQGHVKRASALASRGFIQGIDSRQFKVEAGLVERIEATQAVGRDAGDFLRLQRRSPYDLSQQIGVEAPTWLDTQLATGALQRAPADAPGASTFQRDLTRSLQARAQVLERMGLAEREGQKLRLRAGFQDQLYGRELAAAHERLSPAFGHPVDLRSGGSFSGKLERIEQLHSGPHALLRGEGGNFALVPVQGNMGRMVGRPLQVQLEIGRALPQRAAAVTLQQARVRYLALDSITRQKSLGLG